MGYVIALIPALCWGVMPLISTKVGGSSSNQVFGIGLGALIVSTISMVIIRPSIGLIPFLVAVLSGACWAVGQFGQFASMKKIGVSNTMPLSTAFQLIGNTLIGVCIFHEWQGSKQLILGFFALALVIVGAMLTSITDKSSGKLVAAKDVVFLLLTTIGYVIYSAFPRFPILAHADSVAIYLPETIGILLGVTIYQLITEGPKVFKQRGQYANILSGLLWGIAGLSYIFGARAIGITVAFIFSQLNVILSTLGGIYVLHEQKSPFEMRYTMIGLLLVVIGAVMTAFA
ncbi:MAG: GRP family sugar transporter [Lactobacillus sp.]|jgi:glucose uptake protein|uniref:GRP family sugar transporter n=1 Tax=Limosilactobacillus coleohominis TaxID=181675 RepID=UPI0015BC2433|nr:GRP family sugar transporter [Limosilactobacillus coleohominis]MCI5813010.1 GRP family sugar transporter [Lactobacillus sp.]MDY5628920.1 GRP family sugar transporter [Limosilactobacillus coleohominis]